MGALPNNSPERKAQVFFSLVAGLGALSPGACCADASPALRNFARPAVLERGFHFFARLRRRAVSREIAAPTLEFHCDGLGGGSKRGSTGRHLPVASLRFWSDIFFKTVDQGDRRSHRWILGTPGDGGIAAHGNLKKVRKKSGLKSFDL